MAKIRVVRQVAFEVEEGEKGERRLQEQLAQSLPYDLAIEYSGLTIMVTHLEGPRFETDGDGWARMQEREQARMKLVQEEREKGGTRQ